MVVSRPSLPLLSIQEEKSHGQKFKLLNLFCQRNLSNDELIWEVERNFTKQKIDEAMELIKTHLQILCGNDSIEFIEKFICRVFNSNDDFRPDVAPIFVGKYGVGKSTFCDKIFAKVFGNAYTLFENPSFSNLGMIDKVIGKSMVVLDEVKIASISDYNILKNMITHDRISYRAMYKGITDVENHCVFIILTNEEETIVKKGNGERRFPVFHSANVPTNENYFDILYGIDDYLFSYYFIKKNQNPKFVEECQTFKFRNFKTNIDLNKKVQDIKDNNYALFVLFIFTDPNGKGLWYKGDAFYNGRAIAREFRKLFDPEEKEELPYYQKAIAENLGSKKVGGSISATAKIEKYGVLFDHVRKEKSDKKKDDDSAVSFKILPKDVIAKRFTQVIKMH